MGVKIAKAMGAQVTVLSHSPGKREDALRLGADDFVAMSETDAFEQNAGRFHFILDTVSADHDYNAYLNLLRRGRHDGACGFARANTAFGISSCIAPPPSGGFHDGGIRETQEMLDFCAAHNVAADVEVISMQQINEAYERMLRSDVRYRFVIDMTSLKASSKTANA
jgi:uncharacterized zinc-type alcohol dehydrogenase-like protein